MQLKWQQLNPAVTDLNGPTICIRYQQKFIIANIMKKKNVFQKLLNCFCYRWISISGRSVIVGCTKSISTIVNFYDFYLCKNEVEENWVIAGGCTSVVYLKSQMPRDLGPAFFSFFPYFRCVHASLYEGLSISPSVGRSVRRSVGYAFFSNRGFWVETTYKS